MRSRRSDQAEGLRRLFDPDRLRVVSVSAGTDGAWASINLSAALSEAGSDVLILDAGSPSQSVLAALGLRPHCDLEVVVREQLDLEEAIVQGPGGIKVLSLAAGTRSLACMPLAQRARLMERWGSRGLRFDTLVVGAAARGADVLLWHGSAAQELIVLSGGSAAAITQAYATVKHLCVEFGRRDFHVFISNVASEHEARTIFGNMARVARRHLRVSLDFMGHIAPDEKLLQATRLRLPVVAAFPQAGASGSYRELAQAIRGWPHEGEEGGGFDAFMRRLIQAAQPGAQALAATRI